MQEKIILLPWEKLSPAQKSDSMHLIDEKIPSLGKFTTTFLHKILDQANNRAKREEDLALAAVEEGKIVGIVVARKDLRRKQLWIRFAAGKYSKGTKEYVSKHKTTPVVSMIKRIIRNGEKDRFEPMAQRPRTNAGRAVLEKRIQKILPKTKRFFGRR